MKNTWAERIRIRMDELDLTQEELAGKLDITRGAVAHYLAGRRVPPMRQFHKMAQVLKTDPAWLQFGVVGNGAVQAQVAESKKVEAHRLGVPVLSWHEAGEFVYAAKKKHKEWLPYFYSDQGRWFALKVKNDAMTDTSGQYRNFYEGDFIIVDPEREAEDGGYVVAMLPRTSEAILRQYVVEGGVKYLRPLNRQYSMVKVEKGTVICGAVVGVFAGL